MCNRTALVPSQPGGRPVDPAPELFPRDGEPGGRPVDPEPVLFPRDGQPGGRPADPAPAQPVSLSVQVTCSYSDS